MQSNLFSNLFSSRTTDIQSDTRAAKSKPIELSLAELQHVAGGLAPKGTWSPDATTDAPKGTW